MEMLTAYLPESEGLPLETVINWMFNLVNEIKMSEAKEKNTELDIKMIINETTNTANKKKTRSVSETSEDFSNSKKRSVRLSENSDGGSSDNNLEVKQILLVNVDEMCQK